MIVAALAGAMVGAGLLLLVGWARYRPTLASQLSRIERPGTAAPTASGGGLGDRVGAVERLVQGRLGPVTDLLSDAGIRADLDLLGVDRTTHAARQVLLAVTALVMSPLLLAVVALSTGLPWVAGAWFVLLAVAAAVVVPNARTRAAAKTLRRTFLTTLTAYLELVSMRVASGSGVAEALRDASRVGNGYGWLRLRAALEDARMDGRSPAAGLGRLGTDIAISELTELATQLDLVESTGAQTEATLRAKADALRDRQLTELHGDANVRSQTLVIGQVLLAVGFIVFIGYPALAAVMTF